MANVNITDLTALTDPATADEIEVYDASASQNKRLALSRLVRNDGSGAQITGGGTIALGGYTLTVPATGTAALLETAQTFTAAQKFGSGAGTAQLAIKSQAAGTVGLVVDSAASATAAIMQVNENGTERISVAANGRLLITSTSSTPFEINNGTITRLAYSASAHQFSLSFEDLADSRGPTLFIGRNANASTPAAGNLRIYNLSGTGYYMWPDAAGNFRIGTSSPSNANDTTGTVVGTQTSQRATKDILGDGVDPAAALATVLATPVHRFRYKSGAYNNSEFHGIVTDESPQFGMDDGRVFNPVSAFGYTVQAIKALVQRIEQLEA